MFKNLLLIYKVSLNDILMLLIHILSFKSPLIFLPFLDIFFSFFGNGMIESMLEPHLREDANATQTEIGITFLLLGGPYMVASPIMGYVRI